MAMRVDLAKTECMEANPAPGQHYNLSRMSAACLSCANTASSMADG